MAALGSEKPPEPGEVDSEYRLENNLDPDFFGFGKDEPPTNSGPGNAIRAERRKPHLAGRSKLTGRKSDHP